MDFICPKSPWDLPAYREAVARETFVRDAAFQDITENVAGFELRAMTLRDYLLLRSLKHPLICGGELNASHLLGFIRLLINNPSRFRKAKDLVPPRPPLVKWPLLMRRYERRTKQCLKRVDFVLFALRAYIEETLQDWPSSSVQGREVSYIGEGAAICSVLAREYRWAEREILSMPMKRVLQYLKEIRLSNRGPAAVSNPSDKVTADFIASVRNRN